MIDHRTPHLSLPLPHSDNELGDDVVRVREAFTAIDGKLASIDLLLESDDVSLDQVQELVNAIKINRGVIDEVLVGKASKSELLALSQEIQGVVDGLLQGKADKTALSALSNKVSSYIGVSLEGPTTVYATQTVQYTITDFDVFSEYVVQASAGVISIAGNTITYIAPAAAGNETLTVFVGDMQRDIALEVLPIGSKQPVNTQPFHGAAGTSLRPTFSASAFQWFGLPDTHARSDWEVATDAAFTNVVASSYGNSSNLTSWTPGADLIDDASYYWRVRYHGAAYGASQYSAATMFSTADVYIAAPIITGPAATGVGETPTLSTAAFALVGPSTDVHASTSWEIRTAPGGGGTALWSSLSNATNKLSVTVPAKLLTVSTTYYMRVKHIGTRWGETAWTERAFTTAAAFLPTVIGEPFGGGFYAGKIKIGADTFVLIDGGKASETTLALKTSNDTTPGTSSYNDGLANSNAMNNAQHPAVQHCRNWRGGGFSDWYLGSRDENELRHRNLKPGTEANTTGTRPESGNHGDNANSVPVGASYTTSSPGQTTALPFRTGGAEALTTASPTYYWSSTEYAPNPNYAWIQRLSDGNQSYDNKGIASLVRPLRRLKI